MAGNRRGKLKEQFEGVHRDFEWAKVHIAKSLALIADEKHPLYKGIAALGEGIEKLDELAQNLYSKL